MKTEEVPAPKMDPKTFSAFHDLFDAQIGQGMNCRELLVRKQRLSIYVDRMAYTMMFSMIGPFVLGTISMFLYYSFWPLFIGSVTAMVAFFALFKKVNDKKMAFDWESYGPYISTEKLFFSVWLFKPFNEVQNASQLIQHLEREMRETVRAIKVKQVEQKTPMDADATGDLRGYLKAVVELILRLKLLKTQEILVTTKDWVKEKTHKDTVLAARAQYLYTTLFKDPDADITYRN